MENIMKWLAHRKGNNKCRHNSVNMFGRNKWHASVAIGSREEIHFVDFPNDFVNKF